MKHCSTFRPVAGDPRTGMLSDRYVSPVPDSTIRNCIPWFLALIPYHPSSPPYSPFRRGGSKDGDSPFGARNLRCYDEEEKEGEEEEAVEEQKRKKEKGRRKKRRRSAAATVAASKWKRQRQRGNGKGSGIMLIPANLSNHLAQRT
ncbi:hypothetical protein C4D60_Mb05t00670 [Musa balbisiana]|uniref:Uncharacterized protein n=1 Tax=Musa balbisiana TaxID=52838 RepID=A0A4S8JSS4_MUSBA|nr:hypothetical protein C4D60_Mb05t00670 [Musa balbisiana]